MCGITGAVWTDPAKSIGRETLERMVEVLRHRGPDQDGSYTAGLAESSDRSCGVALGHRRLAVIDVSTGRQPLSNEDGTVWVVANGEIYNYRELRRRLERLGHRFRTESDTECIVHLYEQDSLDFVGQLDGMFAFALWDAPRQRLVLARDRLGEKPLVYREEPGRLLFASELKSILQVPGVPRKIDPNALDGYLAYQYVPHPRTIFQGISKLPPAHLAVYSGGRLEVSPYWQPNFGVEDERPPTEYVEVVQEALQSSVRMRLRSDVPLGAFLSGGMDSSIVVGLMRKYSTTSVRTFSIGFPVREYDETRYARLVAEHFETEHEEFQVEPNAVDILPQLVWHFDEPFADSSAVPTWYLSQFARRSVTVALTGDGGDELFAGYPRYRAVELADRFDRLPHWFRSVLGARWIQRLPSSGRQKSLVRRAKRLLGVLTEPPGPRYLEWISIFNEARRSVLYSPEFHDAIEPHASTRFLDAAIARSDGRDHVTAASLADLVTYLPCDLMTKVDIASMAHGLECRAPFLDHRLVELAIAMPIRFKMQRGRGKHILRQAFKNMLPPVVLRRSKMGFGVPLDRWFRKELRPLAYDVLTDGTAVERGIFRPGAVQTLLEGHQSGRFDHSHRLWALVVLELWLREWMR